MTAPRKATCATCGGSGWATGFWRLRSGVRVGCLERGTHVCPDCHDTGVPHDSPLAPLNVARAAHRVR